LLEISKLGVNKVFGDYDILNDKPGSDKRAKSEEDPAVGIGKEPYSVVTDTNAEIIYMSR
jgi:hypothetical protein